MLSILVSQASRLLPALASHAAPLLPQLIVSTVTHLVTREPAPPSSNSSPSPADAKRT
ncbi:MAG TPA: hypothetical protein PLU79_07515 [Burkholderiaceae bacterium]|nr:hypothetical protein [Burkholderiaceae bacterium]HNB43981.1 hypothetical protein [Burkholderiaceae bacterium]